MYGEKYAKKAKENNKKKQNKQKQHGVICEVVNRKKESSVIVVHLFADTHISVMSFLTPLYSLCFVVISINHQFYVTIFFRFDL